MTVKNGTVDSEVFLQNDYLSLGINAHGGLGSTKWAPSGIAVDTANGYRTVGLLADVDGFGRGATSPLRDGILRGVAVEGFNVGYKIGGDKHVESNQQLDGLTEIAGSSRNASTSTVGQALWSGQTSDKLAVDQKITLVDGAKFIRVDVTLTNNSGSAMTDLRYMRTADPDQGATMSTTNQIVNQGGGQALVTASTTKNGDSPYFLYANDKRAVVSTYGFINEDPYAGAAYDTPQNAGYKVTADQSINITFGLGTLNAGQSTKITFYMGVTDNIAATVAAINADAPPVTPPPTPVAPNAVDDNVAATAGEKTSGNVLSNDVNTTGKTLTAALKTGPEHGVLKLAADGSFTYTADKGYVGTDTFTYTATANGLSDTAKVKIATSAPEPINPSLPDSPTLQRDGTIDGSAATSKVLTGDSGTNSFYFDNSHTVGRDRITNLGANDVLVTKDALRDGNNDGKIVFTRGTLTLSDSSNTVAIDGVTALRSLGTDDAGLSVYGKASVRPSGAVEGKLGDDMLRGDAGDRKVSKFFVDNALGLDLGHDTIANFGSRDVLITTKALGSEAVGGVLSLTDGTVSLGSDLGSVHLVNGAGANLGGIEFDGSAVRDGVTYYVYSAQGSAAGVSTAGLG